MAQARQGGNRSRAHSLLVRQIREALRTEMDLELWPMQPGGYPDVFGRPLRAGPVGMADLCGILSPHGRWLCLEVKTGRARQSLVQRIWGELITQHGGFYRVVRSVDEAREAVRDAKRGAVS